MDNNKNAPDIDRGRAWVILAAAYLGNIIFTAIYYTSGVIYVELIRHFKDDVIKTSLVGSINSGLHCILGPISASAINHFDSRITTLFGGILLATACFTSAFAPSIDWMIFIFGVLGGIGNTFAGIPVAVVTGFSFKKYREIVLTLASVMIGIGMLVSSPMMIAFLDYYGLQGGYIMLSGLSLQLCVIGALLKPSSIERQLKIQRKLSAKTSKQYAKQSLSFGMVSSNKTPVRPNSILSVISKITNVEILKDKAFDFFLVSTMTWNLMTAVCQMHLPNYMTIKGEIPSHIALIMGLFGMSNTIGRLFGTFTVSQRTKIDLIFWHIVFLFVSGANACMFPVYKSFPSAEIVFSIVVGFCTGGANSLLTPITLQILGMAHLSAGYGMNFFFCGVGFLLGPPVAGEYPFLFACLVSITVSTVLAGYGMNFFFCGVGFLLGSPIASILYSSTGTYNASFVFAGCISLVGSCSAGIAMYLLRTNHPGIEASLEDNEAEKVTESLKTSVD